MQAALNNTVVEDVAVRLSFANPCKTGEQILGGMAAAGAASAVMAPVPVMAPSPYMSLAGPMHPRQQFSSAGPMYLPQHQQMPLILPSHPLSGQQGHGMQSLLAGALFFFSRVMERGSCQNVRESEY